VNNTNLLGMIVLALAVGCADRNAAELPAGGAAATIATGTVTVEVTIDGEAKVFVVDAVQDGTTVAAVMRRIKDPVVQIEGSGTTAFVHTIGEVATSGREGWTFKIDGEFSHEGVGTATLHPPTTVSWQYGDFSPPDQ
jgi:hypothetical protein